MACILFVADGSQAIGAGHHMRCAALATAAQAQGFAVHLACRDLPGSTHVWAWMHLPVITFPATIAPAALVRAARTRSGADLTIADHHGLAPSDLASLAGEGPLALIDDIPDRDCAGLRLVINHAPGIVPADYPRTPAAVGPAWALLRPAFWQQPAVAREDDLVLLIAGGTDHLGLLPTLVQRLLAAPRWRLLVVTGNRATADDRVIEEIVAAHRQRLEWRRGASAGLVADAMARAGRGIVAASTVALEALALDLPIVALHTVANQDRLAGALAAAGIAVVRPDALDDPVSLLAQARLGGPGLRVDRRGALHAAARLAECLLPAPLLRPAVWADADLLLEWLNDAAVRQAGFRSDAPVARADHLAWLARRLPDPACRLFIAADGTGALGTVRLDRLDRDPLSGAPADGLAVVSITVAPARRGGGIGRRLLAALADWARASRFARRLRAWVRADNAASLRLFAAAGYHQAGAEAVDGHDARRFELDLA